MKYEFRAPTALAIAAMISITATHGHGQSEQPPSKAPRLERLAEIPADVFTKIVDHSTSPNKQLAVAIGSRDGTGPVWGKSHHTGRAGIAEFSFTLLYPDDSDTANYLLDVRRNRVVGILDGNYWGTRNEYNHVSYAAFWSPDSQWFLECQDWKWGTASCSVHRMNAEGLPVARLGLMPMARKLVEQELLERAPSLTAQERSGYAIRIKVTGITNKGLLTARISGGKPKGFEEKWLFVDLSVGAKIERAKNGGLSIQVVKLLKPQANETE